MATIFSWDGGAFPAVVGTTPTLSGDDAVFPTGSTTSAFQWDVTAVAAFTVRFYVTMPASWPSLSGSIFMAQTLANDHIARLNLAGVGAPGQVRFFRLSGVAGQSSPSSTVATATRYRFEYQVDNANSTLRGAVFAMGTNAPLFDTGLLTGQTMGSDPARFSIGRLSVTADLGDLHIGHIAAVDTVGSWIGPDASDTVAGPSSLPISWDGGAFPAVVGAAPALSGSDVVFPTGSVISAFQWATTDTAALSMRFYFETPASWASLASEILSTYHDNTKLAGISLTGSFSPGQLRFILGATTIANTPPDTLALATRYRVECQVDNANSTLRGAVFAMGTDTPVYDTGLMTSQAIGGDVNAVLIGRTYAVSDLADLKVGHIYCRGNAGAWIGRHNSDTLAETETVLFSWDGGAFPSVVGDAPTLSGSDAVFPSGSTSSALRWDVAPTADYTVRFYATMPTAWASSSGSMFMAQTTNGAANVARLNISGTAAPGQARFLRLASLAGQNSPSNTLITTTRYRFEYQVSNTNATLRGAVFAMGSDVSLYDTGLLTGQTLGYNSVRFLFGQVMMPADFGSLSIGHIKAIAGVGTWVGRHSSDTLVTYTPELLGVWNGSSVTPAEILGVWDGSSVIDAEIMKIV